MSWPGLAEMPVHAVHQYDCRERHGLGQVAHFVEDQQIALHVFAQLGLEALLGVRQALILIWEACGKRLRAMEKHGHLQLQDAVRQRLEAVSAATIDRLLKPVRKTAGSRRKKRPGKRMSREISIKTSHDWSDSLPGHLEIDFVVHGGGSMAGEYLHSLVVTDVCSGWTEAVALLAREQNLVVEGLRRIGAQNAGADLGHRLGQ